MSAQQSSGVVRQRRRPQPLLIGGVTIALIVAGVIVLIATDDEHGAEQNRYVSFDVSSILGKPLRQAPGLQITIPFGYCVPASDADRAAINNIPLLVEIQDRREALVIKARLDVAFVRAMLPDDGPLTRNPCAGIGHDIVRRIQLPSPLGPRALLNGGVSPSDDLPQVVVSSTDPEFRRALRTRQQRLRYVDRDR